MRTINRDFRDLLILVAISTREDKPLNLNTMSSPFQGGLCPHCHLVVSQLCHNPDSCDNMLVAPSIDDNDDSPDDGDVIFKI